MHLHRIWSYIWWFPCQKYGVSSVLPYIHRIYMVLSNPNFNLWLLTLNVCAHAGFGTTHIPTFCTAHVAIIAFFAQLMLQSFSQFGKHMHVHMPAVSRPALWDIITKPTFCIFQVVIIHTNTICTCTSLAATARSLVLLEGQTPGQPYTYIILCIIFMYGHMSVFFNVWATLLTRLLELLCCGARPRRTPTQWLALWQAMPHLMARSSHA